MSTAASRRKAAMMRRVLLAATAAPLLAIATPDAVVLACHDGELLILSVGAVALLLPGRPETAGEVG